MSDQSKIKIAILGIGGVGGYFGGLLAERYLGSKEFEIIFIARGESEKAIKKNGLKLITPSFEKVIFPSHVTNNPEEIGKIDFLICTTKSYHLEESLLHLKNCINENTVILPLLNGIDANDRIKNIFPQAEVWKGCVYIVSRLIEPGVVKETGNIHTLFFGSGTGSQNKLKRLENIFKDSGIDARVSANIEQVVWEKFLFISTIASLTSYLDLSIGEILEKKSHREILLTLLNELSSIAKAKNIYLPADIIERTIVKMERLPFETTSSLHSDFIKGGNTEYKSLTEYVIKLGKDLNIPTPTYFGILKTLENRQVKNIAS